MSNPCKKVDINGTTYIREDLTKTTPYTNDEGLPYAIVRCYRAGVLCGFAEHLGEQNVRIHRARQMYRWNSSFVLVDLSEKGINNADGCRFSVENSNPVVVTDACAILECTVKAAKDLMEHEAESHD